MPVTFYAIQMSSLYYQAIQLSINISPLTGLMIIGKNNGAKEDIPQTFANFLKEK